MSLLRLIFSPLVVLLAPGLIFGQERAKAKQSPALCRVQSLPPAVQSVLKQEFGSWKVQEPAHLSPRAHERWEAEKPLECPGIAVGQFAKGKRPSYAVLLVLQGHTGGGYKLLVFSPRADLPSYEVRAADSGGSGAANFFIHKVRISEFFDEESRRKFHVQASEGILLVDAAENEYETDVYFRSNGNYQHQQVDY